MANSKLQIHIENNCQNRKTAQNNSYGQKWHETTNFCVEVMNSKRLTIEAKTWSRTGTNSRLLCPVNVTFNVPINKVLINYHNTDFCSVGVSIECICLKRYFSFSYPIGGEFKIFVAVSSDELFISILGVVAGLLLLAIALLGHLLGFHIYLSKLHL